jgi:hypothetical protein
LAVYFEQLPCLEAVLTSAADRWDVVHSMHYTNVECTPLHIAAMLDSVEAAELLLNNDADIEGKPVEYTPLHVAAQNRNCKMAYWLLDRGADWKSKTPNGVTALAMVEYHVPDAMTAYLDSCIVLREYQLERQQLLIKVDSSKLTTLPLQITGSLLSEFKHIGCSWRLEHPTCQIMLSCVTDQTLMLRSCYFIYILFGLMMSMAYLMSTYGCICITNLNSTM